MKIKTEARRAQIIAESAKLFKEKGFASVSMRDIAAVLNIKASSLYNHISSKDQILNNIVLGVAEQFVNGLNNIKSLEVNAVQKLQLVIAQHVKISLEQPYKLACLNNDWMHLVEHKYAYLELRNNYENDLKTIFLDGIKTGEIIDLEVDLILFSFLTTLRSLYLWLPKQEEIDVDLISSNLTQVLINGILIK